MIIHGKTSLDIVVPLLVGSDGSVSIAGANPSYLNPAGVLVSFANTALPAGGSTQTVYTVPADQRMILKFMTYRYTGTVAGVFLVAAVTRSAVLYELQRVSGFVTNQLHSVGPDVIIDAGDTVDVVVNGATLNDDLNVDLFLNRIK